MRAINHTVTGAAIGAAIGSGWAIPLALVSHLVLDIIPHSGGTSHVSSRFKIELLLDAALSAGFLLAVLLLQPYNWPIIVASGIFAAIPDLWWLPYWVQELRGKKMKLDPIGNFLSRIQWSETQVGYLIEATWLVAVFYAFLRFTV